MQSLLSYREKINWQLTHTHTHTHIHTFSADDFFFNVDHIYTKKVEIGQLIFDPDSRLYSIKDWESKIILIALKKLFWKKRGVGERSEQGDLPPPPSTFKKSEVEMQIAQMAKAHLTYCQLPEGSIIVRCEVSKIFGYEWLINWT